MAHHPSTLLPHLEPASSPGGRGLNRSSDASRQSGEHLQRGRVFVEQCPHRSAVSLAASGPYRAPGKWPALMRCRSRVA